MCVIRCIIPWLFKTFVDLYPHACMRGVQLTLLLAHCRHGYTSRAVVKDAQIDPAFRPVVEERLLDLGAIFGIEDFLSGWFKDAPFESLKCVSALFAPTDQHTTIFSLLTPCLQLKGSGSQGVLRVYPHNPSSSSVAC